MLLLLIVSFACNLHVYFFNILQLNFNLEFTSLNFDALKFLCLIICKKYKRYTLKYCRI